MRERKGDALLYWRRTHRSELYVTVNVFGVMNSPEGDSINLFNAWNVIINK